LVVGNLTGIRRISTDGVEVAERVRATIDGATAAATKQSATPAGAGLWRRMGHAIATAWRPKLRVDAEMFRWARPHVLAATLQARAAGVEIHGLFDPMKPAVDQARQALHEAKVDLTPYARRDSLIYRELSADVTANASPAALDAVDLKQHSKAVVVTGDGMPRAMVFTAALEQPDTATTDLGFEFGGEAAAQLSIAKQTSPDDLKSSRAAYGQLARLGVAYNDPLTGVHLLTDGLFEQIDAAHTSILAATKELTSVKLAHRLADAADRGVAVSVVTRHVSDECRRILAQAKISPVVTSDISRYEHPLHGNIWLFDGTRASVGTAWGCDRALNLNKHFQSREVAVFTLEPAAVDAAKAAFTLCQKST
jgi:phosphatidylserine/phosphatidylglycerophosphate/cardiolipin synthase-like enzyme